ncbi:MAG: DUF2911 domain-containing protein [Myxococcota bacterium]
MMRHVSSFAVVVMLASTGLAWAQEKRPASPQGTAAAVVGGKWSEPDKSGERSYSGGKWIEVTYGRPILRGRANIFGSGADYGKTVLAGAKVWRAGANATTRLTTEAPLMIGGKRVEPGTYSVFVELKEGAWTLIVSTQPAAERYDPNDKTKIWGSYGYDPKFDVVRVPMQMETLPHAVEQFTISFVDMTEGGGKLMLAWEKTGATVPFTLAK